MALMCIGGVCLAFGLAPLKIKWVSIPLLVVGTVCIWQGIRMHKDDPYSLEELRKLDEAKKERLVDVSHDEVSSG
jgi:hypothetical protein